jgi:hypothetical protein
LNAIKILIHVEGFTEERFIKDILCPHFEQMEIYLIPIIATTKVVQSGPNNKGGLPSFKIISKELSRLLGDTSAKAVTTMYDYYKLPNKFPGKENPEGINCYEKTDYIETKISEHFKNSKLIPYIQIHEFENLLFSSPITIANVFSASENLKNQLQAIRDQKNNAEEINDGSATHAGKRLIEAFPKYQKPFDGSRIAKKIGLSEIRNHCPHFDEWIKKLEQLAN